MKEQLVLSIIIPVKNEEDNILPLIKNIQTYLKHINYEIIIVSDSNDNTNKLVKNIKNIQLYTPGCNDLSQSVIKKIKKSSGKYLVVMDGDGSHPPSIIPQMMKQAQKDTLVIGVRDFKKLTTSNWSRLRKIISAMGRFGAYPVLPISDPMSGLFLFPKENIKRVKLKTRGYKILLEIATRGNFTHIKEIPYTFIMREHGKSKINTIVIWKYIIQLPYLYWEKWKKQK